jgi:photosystem II stability/assembly factor-like uncharacterized protein
MAWQQATIQGGGFIAGLLQDGTNSDVMYARSDVAGVFKSIDRGKSWFPINHGMSECHHHDVQSFAINPHYPEILFRCSGSVRGKNFFGTIHKTVNGGEYWYPVCREADFYGNGETRQYGEVIQVSPHNPDIVAVGAYTSGVWISMDGGETWHNRGLQKERISCVVFHPLESDTIFIGTIGSYDKNPKFVEQQYDFVRPNPARLYCSRNNGLTWEILYEGMDFAEIVFDPLTPATLYAACIQSGVMKSVDSGYTWKSCAPHLSKYPIGTLALDPKNTQRLVTAAMTFPNFDNDVPPIGVYETLDGGNSWNLIRWHSVEDIRNYPAYMSLEYAGWAIAKIRIDHQDSERLYITNWYGVSTSMDGGQTWDANHFAGMENLCIENIVAHPTDANIVYMVTADHPPRYSVDGGCTFNMMPRPDVETPQPDSTAIVTSRFDSQLVLYGIKGTQGCSIMRSIGYDTMPQIVLALFASPDTAPSELAFQSRAAGVSVQALIEDPHHPGTFYAYIDGILEAGAGIYRTQDYGAGWEQLAIPFPEHIQRIPYDREWIENELLSVVVAQTKNVCGTNQLLCVDPHRIDTLYVGEWTEGFYRSVDAGRSWESVGEELPFKNEHASVLNVIRADPYQKGVLYAGFIREGLWRSRDYGDHWEKLYPLDARNFNATSVAIGEKHIVIVSEPLIHSPSPSSVMVTSDNGTTWTDIYAPSMGAIRWKTVALSADGCRLYAGSCGNSAFYYDLPEKLS